MEYKSLDLIELFSWIFSAISLLCLAALTFGPWAQPSAETARMDLTGSWVAFSMIAGMARSVRALLEEQADQIAALKRQLAEQRPAA